MKRIVIKLGTGVLTEPSGLSLNLAQFDHLTSQFAALINAGHSVVVVSSGAITAGLPVLGLEERPTDLTTRQACACIGQPHLIRQFSKDLARFHIHTAQLLFTHEDIDSVSHRCNARNTFERLLQAPRLIPIVNENDAIAVDEINLGDNDRLSAEIAMLLQADLLIMLTSVDGLLKDGVLLPEITDIDKALEYITSEKGTFSRGGMRSKLESAHYATQYGTETIIANGYTPEIILSAVKGYSVGTRLPAQLSNAMTVNSSLFAPSCPHTFS